MPLIRTLNPGTGKYEAPPLQQKQKPKSMLDRLILVEKQVAELQEANR